MPRDCAEKLGGIALPILECRETHDGLVKVTFRLQDIDGDLFIFRFNPRERYWSDSGQYIEKLAFLGIKFASSAGFEYLKSVLSDWGLTLGPSAEIRYYLDDGVSHAEAIVRMIAAISALWYWGIISQLEGERHMTPKDIKGARSTLKNRRRNHEEKD